MQTISLKMEDKLLSDIDTSLKTHRYSTRTEFIRDAVRRRLTDLEKEQIFRRLEQMKGSLKGKAKMSHEEAGEIAFKRIAKRLGVVLE